MTWPLWLAVGLAAWVAAAVLIGLVLGAMAHACGAALEEIEEIEQR